MIHSHLKYSLSSLTCQGSGWGCRQDVDGTHGWGMEQTQQEVNEGTAAGQELRTNLPFLTRTLRTEPAYKFFLRLTLWPEKLKI